eukprot:1549381-Prymnesium_polylepis.1
MATATACPATAARDASCAMGWRTRSTLMTWRSAAAIAGMSLQKSRRCLASWFVFLLWARFPVQ